MSNTYNFSDLRNLETFVSEQFESAFIECYQDDVISLVTDELDNYLDSIDYSYGEDIDADQIPCVFELAKPYELED